MIRFNTLLREEGVDPAEVKLVRHQDTRCPGRTPYQLWMAADGTFDFYQRMQGRLVFDGATVLGSFVATSFDETLFVGLYDINGVGVVPQGTIDPLSGHDVSGLHLYELNLSPKLADYRGRLTIDWGPGFRSWVQRAGKQDKQVIEIRRAAGEPPFPGFLDFRSNLSALVSVPLSWRIALSSVNGIYLLACPSTGRQYVGLAHGIGGFWGRWEEYVASGHGGNKRMLDIPASDYQVSILEVASSSANVEALAKMESRWKQKLLSRQFGLNAN